MDVKNMERILMIAMQRKSNAVRNIINTFFWGAIFCCNKNDAVKSMIMSEMISQQQHSSL